jgi:hypothetical protein
LRSSSDRAASLGAPLGQRAANPALTPRLAELRVLLSQKPVSGEMSAGRTAGRLTPGSPNRKRTAQE